MNFKCSLIFIFCINIFFSCQKETRLKTSQIAYFELTYENHAWGSFYGIIMIDGDGNILIPSQSSFSHLNYPDDNNQLSSEDLVHNLSIVDSVIQTVPQMELDIAIDKIPATLNSSLGKEENVGADRGKYQYYAYLLLENGKYQKILLGQRGDWNRYSNVTEADELVDFINTFL